MDFLEQIIKAKKKALGAKKTFFGTHKERLDGAKMSRYHLFKKAIAREGEISLIAEIKKASPSQGLIRENFDCRSLAKTYVESQAAAISILTEERYFLGKLEYIRQVTDEFKVPVLRKDFLTEEVEVYESYRYGASAILLIMAILDDARARTLLEAAARLDLDCLVEVHDEEELDRALQIGAEIVGINNRNLHTFAVDLNVSRNLIPKVPPDKVIVVESGIKSHAEIKEFARLGANAVLIGETFLRAEDVAGKVREVMGY